MSNPLRQLSFIVSSAAGVGTTSAMQKASSPKGILQYIINLLTLGGVRRDNEKEYQAFVQSMADELSKSGYNRGGEFPEKIIMNDLKGYKVEFSLPAPNSSSERVIIEVSKNNLSESAEVPFETFEKVCKALMFRREFSITQHGIILTEKGGMYLKDANLSGIKLTQEDLSYADLRNARMDEKSDLFMTNLSYANLKGCCLFGVQMYNTNLSGACLEDAVISGGLMNNCKVIEANFKYAHLTGSRIIGCDLTRADMKNTALLACNISYSNLQYCDLSGANMLAAELNDDNLTRANLKQTNLNNSTLTNLNLTEADLTNTQLDNCTFTNLCLEGAIMSKAANLLLNDFYNETLQNYTPPKDIEVQ
jgi:secreted effector protein PipB2